MVSMLAQLRPLMPDLFIGLDFDGPIAPIVDHPDQSRPVPGAVQTIRELLERGVQVAIITGRDVRTVLKLGEFSDLPGLVVSGLYGAELWRDGELVADEEVAGISELRHSLPAILHMVDDRLWIEDKGLSLVVHSRRTHAPEQVLTEIRPILDRLAGELLLGVHPGKCVLEMRAPGYDKARAIGLLLSAYSPSGALFAGDDLGDIPGFEGLRAWSQKHAAPAVCVAVGERAEVRAAADVTVGRAEVLFQELAGLL